MSENGMPQIDPKALAPTRGGIVTYLQVSDANAASAFYQKAFAAEEKTKMARADGKVFHCHMYINGASLMLSDAFPDQGMPLETPAAFSLTLMVDDIEAWFRRAEAAGCTVTQPVSKMFWGARYASLRDPFGVAWAMNEAPTG